MTPPGPRGLSSPDEALRRRALLGAAHMAPLRDFVLALRAERPQIEFPDFDPLDGGIKADILFLLEKPGPKASSKGSGFISRDNGDPTAEATFRFMTQAGIPRERTVIWNVMPGWNGTIAIGPGELADGVRSLRTLLPLLPRLHTVVLVGRRAQKALPMVEGLGHRVLQSAHPSPQVRAAFPEVWRAIPLQWAAALESGGRDR